MTLAVILTPDPGEDRTWTREKWIHEYRMCRVMGTYVNSIMPWDAIDRCFMDTLLYGRRRNEMEARNR